MSTPNNIMITMVEGDTSGYNLKCETTIPVVCDTYTRSACDLQLWLNYVDQTKFDRIVVKECNPNSNGASGCDGCGKFFSKNPSFSQSSNKIIWRLTANMESKNLNYQNEMFEIVIKSNKNSTNLRPFWANVMLPNIIVIKSSI
jgi:hypothetical protein